MSAYAPEVVQTAPTLAQPKGLGCSLDIIAWFNAPIKVAQIPPLTAEYEV
jgi:hypothetical protein